MTTTSKLVHIYVIFCFVRNINSSITMITRSNRYFRRVLGHSSNGEMFTRSPVAYLPMHRVKMSKRKQTILPSEIALKLAFGAIKIDQSVPNFIT